MPGLGQIPGAVEVTQLLGGDVGRGDLPARVAGAQPGQEPAVGLLGEVLRAAQQDPADAVERVALAAAVPTDGLLNSPSALIERLASEARDVEGI